MRTWRIPRVRANIGEPALFVDVAIARGDYAGLEGGQEDVRKLSSLALCKVIRLTTSSSPSVSRFVASAA